jgi:hypothetical protein
MILIIPGPYLLFLSQYFINGSSKNILNRFVKNPAKNIGSILMHRNVIEIMYTFLLGLHQDIRR